MQSNFSHAAEVWQWLPLYTLQKWWRLFHGEMLKIRKPHHRVNIRLLLLSNIRELIQQCWYLTLHQNYWDNDLSKYCVRALDSTTEIAKCSRVMASDKNVQVTMNLLNVDGAELGYWRSAIYMQHQVHFEIDSNVIPQSRITTLCQM
jgi:hypothetical protein